MRVKVFRPTERVHFTISEHAIFTELIQKRACVSKGLVGGHFFDGIVDAPQRIFAMGFIASLMRGKVCAGNSSRQQEDT